MFRLREGRQKARKAGTDVKGHEKKRLQAALRVSKKWLSAAFSSFYGFCLSLKLPGGKTRKVRKPEDFHAVPFAALPYRVTCRVVRCLSIMLLNSSCVEGGV